MSYNKKMLNAEKQDVRGTCSSHLSVHNDIVWPGWHRGMLASRHVINLLRLTLFFFLRKFEENKI